LTPRATYTLFWPFPVRSGDQISGKKAKTAQVLSFLNENFFDFFDLAVKNFCKSRIALGAALFVGV
jgi:hypothetical protein